MDVGSLDDRPRCGTRLRRRLPVLCGGGERAPPHARRRRRPWSDDAARSLLEAQFGEVPFALVLVDIDGEAVYVGRDAAKELCERAGLPVLVGDLLGENYESVADAVRTVSGADREPGAHHGTFDLTRAAAERYPRLAESAETPAAGRHVDIT
jgi:SAM-dependent methyltransferase